jgi:hypothetical protein
LTHAVAGAFVHLRAMPTQVLHAAALAQMRLLSWLQARRQAPCPIGQLAPFGSAEQSAPLNAQRLVQLLVLGHSLSCVHSRVGSPMQVLLQVPVGQSLSLPHTVVPFAWHTPRLQAEPFLQRGELSRHAVLAGKLPHSLAGEAHEPPPGQALPPHAVTPSVQVPAPAHDWPSSQVLGSGVVEHLAPW